MASLEEESEPIFVTRVEDIISPKDGKSTARAARFLKPYADHVDQAVGLHSASQLYGAFPCNLKKWPSNVLFKGWKLPQKKLEEWVDRLAGKYGAVWFQTGIFDAILSSLCEVRCNRDLVLGLSEFWCPATNTFVFPWGEATITLEDLMIIGGLPVIGDSPVKPITGESAKIQEEMEKRRIEFSRSKSKKADHYSWLKHFMENESELQHIAFLSLWLSRYVFPSVPEETIGKHVFPIAARLDQGEKIALAPAVLASIYQNLTNLRENALNSSELIVWAPFQLVQLWVLERFPNLVSKFTNSLRPGEPRAARWHKIVLNLNSQFVRSSLKSGTDFHWRPYASDLENWRHPLYYSETEQFVLNCSGLDDELKSFLQFLNPSELMGLGCKEKYLPFRVAMQFGFDQDLPADLSVFGLTSENCSFFVPARSFQPGVSLRYFNWWKDLSVKEETTDKQIAIVEPSTNSTTVAADKQVAILEPSTSSRTDAADKQVAIVEPSTNSTTEAADKQVAIVEPSTSSRTEAADKQVAIVEPSTNSTTEAADKQVAIVGPSTSSRTEAADKQVAIVEPSTNSTTEAADKQVAIVEPSTNSTTEAADKQITIVGKRKRKYGCSIDYPIEIIEQEKQNRRGEVKGINEAGQSLNNPIDVDDYMLVTRLKFQKLGADLEVRVQKMEKLLFIIPD